MTPVLRVNLLSESQTHSATCLGVFVADEDRIPNFTVEELRASMLFELPSLPANFTFVTKDGWPVLMSQENVVNATRIISDGSISIRRNYYKPKIGVITKTGHPIGFVFIEHNKCVSQLRESVTKQLSFFHGIDDAYQFLDANGWPISRQQEGQLTVVDVLVRSCIYVCADVNTLQGTVLRSVEDSSTDESIASDKPKKKRIKRLRELRELSFNSSKDLLWSSSNDNSLSVINNTKQILLSYVRAEAASHALQLKQELSALGFSVYLDVHEIKTGLDWQDSLNFAIRNCQLFVPLITPRYGETQWTNREVKLADVIGKFILPVAFVEEWPPRCLAIQFATTQYILWKPFEEIKADTGHAWDIRIWEPAHVKIVSDEIAQRFSSFNGSTKLNTSYSLKRRPTVLRSCAANLPADLSDLQMLMADREGRPLVVISVHPDQDDFGKALKLWLENLGYEVWCSSDLIMDDGDTLSLDDLPFSQMSQVLSSSDPILEYYRRFQEKADEAGIVIIVLSEAFANSKTCKQQVFYCEHRKRMIPLRFDDSCIPSWMGMLMGTSVYEDARHENYKESLLARIRRALDPVARETPGESSINEAMLTSAVAKVKKTLPMDCCVYISGATKLRDHSSEMLCREIGKNLAMLRVITVVTGGLYGVGETVSKTFNEVAPAHWLHHETWHIVPVRDPQNQTHQGRQNEDGTFQHVPFGKTLFCGDSIKERECTVARVCDICILIEGGPESVHEAEQFAWNDRIVIPVRCITTRGGVGNMPEKIFEVPQGVSESDWSVLSSSSASPDVIGQTVSRIVSSLIGKLKIENNAAAIASAEIKPPKTPKSPIKKRKTDLRKMKTMILG